MFHSLNETLANINVYVDDDGALHFVDKDGADSVLPFSNLDISYLGICHAKTNTCAQAAIVTMATKTISQSYVAQVNATSKNNGVLNMVTNNSTSLAVATAYALKKGTYLYIATTNASTYKGMSLLAVGIKEVSDDVSTTLCSVSNAVDVSLFVAKLN